MKMDGGAAAGGDSAPQENGVTATNEVAPSACLPARKQKSSKTTQPSAVASRPPTVPCGASKTLNSGPVKKPNVSQTKPLMPKSSSVSNTVGRIAVKKAVGEKPNGVKTSEKLVQNKEVQQKTAKWAPQPAVSGMFLLNATSLPQYPALNARLMFCRISWGLSLGPTSLFF